MSSRPTFRFAGILLLASLPLSAATYTVTNTGDTGAGSLRQAITDANGTAAADTIAFNIPGGGLAGGVQFAGGGRLGDTTPAARNLIATPYPNTGVPSREARVP